LSLSFVFVFDDVFCLVLVLSPPSIDGIHYDSEAKHYDSDAKHYDSDAKHYDSEAKHHKPEDVYATEWLLCFVCAWIPTPIPRPYRVAIAFCEAVLLGLYIFAAMYIDLKRSAPVVILIAMFLFIVFCECMAMAYKDVVHDFLAVSRPMLKKSIVAAIFCAAVVLLLVQALTKNEPLRIVSFGGVICMNGIGAYMSSCHACMYDVCLW
jgi:hypothetical protein